MVAANVMAGGKSERFESKELPMFVIDAQIPLRCSHSLQTVPGGGIYIITYLVLGGRPGLNKTAI